MKKLLFTSLFAACAAFGLSSCNNGDYDANPLANTGTANPLNTGGSGGSGGGGNSSFNWSGSDPMSAKIDGTAVQATSSLIQHLNSNGIDADIITGSLPGGAQLSVSFPHNSPIGTYNCGNSQNAAIIYTSGTTGYNTAASGSGQIQITETDATHIKGKFYGVGKDVLGGGSATISEGYFNVNW